MCKLSNTPRRDNGVSKGVLVSVAATHYKFSKDGKDNDYL